jgi:hypothetical protein
MLIPSVLTSGEHGISEDDFWLSPEKIAAYRIRHAMGYAHLRPMKPCSVDRGLIVSVDSPNPATAAGRSPWIPAFCDWKPGERCSPGVKPVPSAGNRAGEPREERITGRRGGRGEHKT